MRYRILLTLFLSILIFAGCIQEPVENPEGKYGSSVDQSKQSVLSDILSKEGVYLNREIVVSGVISELSEQLNITTFTLTSGSDKIKCSFENMKLPKSLEGQNALVQGSLVYIQVASQAGRQPGGENVFAADPTGGSYKEELRLKVKGFQIIKQAK